MKQSKQILFLPWYQNKTLTLPVISLVALAFFSKYPKATGVLAGSLFISPTLIPEIKMRIPYILYLWRNRFGSENAVQALKESAHLGYSRAQDELIRVHIRRDNFIEEMDSEPLISWLKKGAERGDKDLERHPAAHSRRSKDHPVGRPRLSGLDDRCDVVAPGYAVAVLVVSRWSLVPIPWSLLFHPNRARPTDCLKSPPRISTRTHISASRDRIRSPIRSPRVGSRAARSASVLAPPPAGRSA